MLCIRSITYQAVVYMFFLTFLYIFLLPGVKGALTQICGTMLNSA